MALTEFENFEFGANCFLFKGGLISTFEPFKYSDARRDEWQVLLLPALKKLPLEVLVTMSGMSRRAIIDLRAGRSRPHRRNREVLVTILKNVSLV